MIATVYYYCDIWLSFSCGTGMRTYFHCWVLSVAIKASSVFWNLGSGQETHHYLRRYHRFFYVCLFDQEILMPEEKV